MSILPPATAPTLSGRSIADIIPPPVYTRPQLIRAAEHRPKARLVNGTVVTLIGAHPRESRARVIYPGDQYPRTIPNWWITTLNPGRTV